VDWPCKSLKSFADIGGLESAADAYKKIVVQKDKLELGERLNDEGASHVKAFQSRSLLSLLVLLSAACGRQLVESPATDAGGSDRRADVAADAPATGTGGMGGSRVDAMDAPRGDAVDAPGRDLPADLPGADLPRVDAMDASRVDGLDASRPDLPSTDGPRPDAVDAPGPDLGPDLGRFDAGDASGCFQVPVVLGAAANFAVLAGPTVTNTGLTVVNGDLGTFPGAAIAGFGPGVIVGTQHPGDTAAMLAQGALTTAYNDAAGRTLCPIAVSGNLGGLTLTPGLYKSTDFLEISSGDLTLDGQGDPNAIFIFQMASTLNTTTGRLVLLTGLAKASNIFWQVGTSATLGSMSIFQGTIMADQSVILTSGAVLNGRALARIAGITLDTNAITLPP
jgi:Ice-binding-like